MLLILFLSQFTLSSLLFIYSSFYFCNYYHKGYYFSYQKYGYHHYCHHRYDLKLRHLCCYYYNIIFITVFAVVSSQVIAFAIIIMFTTIISITIYSVSFIFLFWIFSICCTYCMTSFRIPFIYSLQLFSYSHTIFSVDYSHPTAAEVLIVYLRTAYCIVTPYFKKFSIYYLECLILIVI